MRRVGELQEEDLLARDRVDRGQVGAAGEDVERVQAGAERGVVGGLDDPPRVVVLADVPAPGQRLVGDLQAALVGAVGERVQLLGGELVVVDRVRRDVRADQDRVHAELLHHVELGLGAAQVALRAAPAAPPRSRGTAGRGRCSGPSASARSRTSAGASGELIRSGSKISTPSKPAAAAASSFSSSVPLRQTVAIERRIRRRRPRVSVGEVAQHPLAVGRDAGEQLERAGGLHDGHPAAVERPAAELARALEQLGLERAVDDLGDPQLRRAAAPPGAAGRGARPCRSAWRGSARRRRRARRGRP